jgi:methyl-accepting chemotaxis protein
MEGIVTQVKRVSALINEISNASAEQSSGISQIGDAVNQLDQVTQQNAALVEGKAAAADSLKNQSQRLAELVSVFKLDARRARPPRGPRPAPRPRQRHPAVPRLARPAVAPKRVARCRRPRRRRPRPARGRQRRLGVVLSAPRA